MKPVSEPSRLSRRRVRGTLGGMRIGIVVTLAVAALGLPRAAFAQGEEVTPDGGVAAENAPLVIEIVEDGEPASVEAPSPAQKIATPAPIAQAQPDAEPQMEPTSVPKPALKAKPKDSPVRALYPRERDNLRTLAAHALGTFPYAGTAGIGFLIYGLGSLIGGFDSSDDGEHETTAERERKQRVFGEPYVSIVLPIAGAISVFASSGIMYKLQKSARTYRVGYGAFLLGAIVGFAADMALMCALWFGTDSYEALVLPTAFGFVILPPLGSTIASIVARKPKVDPPQTPSAAASRSWRVTVIPLPIALPSADGGAAPGLGIAGRF